MSLAVLPPDLPEVLVERVIIGEEAITFVARLTSPAMPCPGCTQPATRVHSRSRRLLNDLPAGGRRVQLSLQMRRFFCLNPACLDCEGRLRSPKPHAASSTFGVN